MGKVREPHVDLSADQIDILCDLLDVARPAGIDPERLAGAPTAVREYLQAHAIDELRDRRILAGEGPDAMVDEAVATVLRATGAPGLLLVASVEVDGVAESRFYAADPELAVEEAPIAADIYRFIPFPPRELLRRAVRFADLRPHDEPDVEGFQVASSVLDAVGEAVINGGVEEAERLLQASGAPAASAAAFAATASGVPRTVSVTIMYRPSEDKVAGGSLTWLDGGLDGLWVAEPVEADELAEDPMVELAPSTGRAVARELLSYLPPAFANPSAASGDAR